MSDGNDDDNENDARDNENTFEDNNDDDKNNIVTEIVYLKDNLTAKGKKSKTSFEPVKKSVKETPADYEDQHTNEELDTFGKYVTSLLKKMPSQLATKLQMEIVTLIITTKLNSEMSKKNETSVNSNNSIVVSLPSASINKTNGHEYIQGYQPITVENVPIAKHNYTLTSPQITESAINIETEEMNELPSLAPILKSNKNVTNIPTDTKNRQTFSAHTNEDVQSEITIDNTVSQESDSHSNEFTHSTIPNRFSTHGYSFTISRNSINSTSNG